MVLKSYGLLIPLTVSSIAHLGLCLGPSRNREGRAWRLQEGLGVMGVSPGSLRKSPVGAGRGEGKDRSYQGKQSKLCPREPGLLPSHKTPWFLLFSMQPSPRMKPVNPRKGSGDPVDIMCLAPAHPATDLPELLPPLRGGWIWKLLKPF